MARLFALPMMRKRAYPMLLDRAGSLTAQLPDADGKAMLISLESLRITHIQHPSTSEEVRRAIEQHAVAGAASSQP